MFNQPSTNGSVIEGKPEAPFAPSTPGKGPQGTAVPLSSQRFISPEPKPKGHSIVEALLLIIVTIVAIVFIYLFIAKYVEWDSIRMDIDAQVDAATAMAVAENTTKLEEEFAEREKYPYKSFMGPADYGSVAFEHPRTWSVYVAKDALQGGDYEAYFNPGQVEPIAMETICSLRLTIRDMAFDNVVTEYDNMVSAGYLQFSTRQLSGGVLANLYVGQIPSTTLQGAVLIFKLRDKTVILQTDADLFIGEFYKILDTVTMIQ